jgi:hypothetical protein
VHAGLKSALATFSHATAVEQGNIVWAMDVFNGRGRFSVTCVPAGKSRSPPQYGEVAAFVFAFFLFFF